MCGEHTQLFAAGTPLCLKCESAGPEELKVRKELKSSPNPALLEHTTMEHDGSQIALVRVLETDLDLGFILLRIAQTEANKNPIHSKAALRRSHSALNDIRRLARAIEDTEAAKEIQAKADELENGLSAFSGLAGASY